MNIGIDIDGTITRNTALFSLLTHCFLKAGHRVFIITYRDKSLKEETIVWLKQVGISYTQAVFCPDWTAIDAAKWKAGVAERHNLDVMFEDSLDNLTAMPENMLKFLVLPGGY